MPAASSILAILDLPEAEFRRLRSDAKALGLTPERYARQLIETGLALKHRARTQSFDELFVPAQQAFRSTGMTEADLDATVDRARHKPRGNARRKR